MMQSILDSNNHEIPVDQNKKDTEDSGPMIDITLILGSMDGNTPHHPPCKMGAPDQGGEPDWKELALSLIDMLEDMGIDTNDMREGRDGAAPPIPPQHQELRESPSGQRLPREEATERKEAGDQRSSGSDEEEEDDSRTDRFAKKRPNWKW